ncbi:molybdopterin-dependent oxidoreductase [Amycolatopsis sp. NPDC051372]|uniref:molybdopterin-dependent oxidoreductase n=1 Tax=Amycolatopsis sp. NPDC051372 TaxID=3155669 RepID=UPI0034138917
MAFTRNFHSKRRAEVDPARVPPGQYVTPGFPVLSAGPTPKVVADDWTFTVREAAKRPVTWTWDALRSLPSESITVDIHCVTKWSKLDTTWTGVSLDTLLDSVETRAGYAHVVLTVERLDDGEVSPYLVDELRVGDEVELRGPVGGHFVWESGSDSPVLLVAGGSGVVPFRSMLRHHAAAGSTVPMRLLYSARSRETLIYADEFTRIGGRGGIDIRVTLTRENSGTGPGEHGRIDRDFLTRAGLPPTEEPLVYVCGPTGFVETVANTLVDLGHRPERIRTERFSGTGTP